MSEPQIKKRVRRRSLAVQLQAALDDAAKAMSADISVQKLVQARIDCLLKLQAREGNDKLKRAETEVERLTVENQRLKQELAAALAKPAARPTSAVTQVLAQYEAEKSAGGEQ
jgi:hypothetical protein